MTGKDIMTLRREKIDELLEQRADLLDLALEDSKHYRTIEWIEKQLDEMGVSIG